MRFQAAAASLAFASNARFFQSSSSTAFAVRSITSGRRQHQYALSSRNSLLHTAAAFGLLTSSSSSKAAAAMAPSVVQSCTSSKSRVVLNSAVTSSDVETTSAAAAPKEIFRSDYRPLPYTVSDVQLEFDIRDNLTTVRADMILAPNVNVGDDDDVNVTDDDLVLDGDESCVKLLSIEIDGRPLVEGQDYELQPGRLILKASALKSSSSSHGDTSSNSSTVLSTIVEIIPEENTQLSGFYKSGPMYCSQCEAMGFRRITYYPDRPDNMATFSGVRIEADEAGYPVLLSNGNLQEAGKLDNGRHFAVWADPFPKPSYLFAVVAGDLGGIRDTFTTMSGREVRLEVFSEKENVGKLGYAMESLKRSMKWDEDAFGLEYDLGIYNIVAVNDFNMGAMENKGLNVFNTAYVLADPSTASDLDYQRIEGVIGHEYFHNWTGNRVTCRDWFQLTLKEGLTVFRDQEFSGDMNSNAVKRIEDVRTLRGGQFNEDAGPMSHPIRPESYISMDNFYTATVYSKGAEVIRMYRTLLTKEGFRRGMDLYFERHDGQAVTCDDFRAAMADANSDIINDNLEQFGRWYSTNGTPVVTYAGRYSADTGVYALTLTQDSNSDANCPLHIPVSIGLLDRETGEEVLSTTVLHLREDEQVFEFDGLRGDVVPSILRDFSAPVKLVSANAGGKEEEEEMLAFLAARDTDGFNKWEAGQKIYTSLIVQTLAGGGQSQSDATLKYALEAFGRTLTATTTDDCSIQAYALTLPSESALAEDLDVVDPTALRAARGTVKATIARHHAADIQKAYDALTASMSTDAEFKVDSIATGRRLLRNVLLDYLCSMKDTVEEQQAAANLALTQFRAPGTGMTDKLAALNALASMDGAGAAARDAALQEFYEDANGDALVLNKWFSVQAMSHLPDVLDRVKALTKHPDFTLTNPNRCRSLLSAFAMNNAAPFHEEGGAGYRFLGEILAELDALNPQVASRSAGALIQWRRYDETRGGLMRAELEKLAAMKPISDDLFEVVTRGLK